MMHGDGQAEQNLRENPFGALRVNERNVSVESEYEYGSRAGFWRLFRLFNEHKMKYTMYAVAQALPPLRYCLLPLLLARVPASRQMAG